MLSLVRHSYSTKVLTHTGTWRNIYVQLYAYSFLFRAWEVLSTPSFVGLLARIGLLSVPSSWPGCPRPICVKCKFKSYWKRGLCDSSRRCMKRVCSWDFPSSILAFHSFCGFPSLFLYFCWASATKNVTPSAVIEAGVIDWL